MWITANIVHFLFNEGFVTAMTVVDGEIAIIAFFYMVKANFSAITVRTHSKILSRLSL